MGADGAELFFDVFVASINVVDAVDDRFPIGDQRGEDKRCGGPKVGGQDGCGTERSFAAHHCPAAFDFYIRAHAH